MDGVPQPGWISISLVVLSRSLKAANFGIKASPKTNTIEV